MRIILDHDVDPSVYAGQTATVLIQTTDGIEIKQDYKVISIPNKRLQDFISSLYMIQNRHGDNCASQLTAGEGSGMAQRQTGAFSAPKAETAADETYRVLKEQATLDELASDDPDRKMLF